MYMIRIKGNLLNAVNFMLKFIQWKTLARMSFRTYEKFVKEMNAKDTMISMNSQKDLMNTHKINPEKYSKINRINKNSKRLKEII